MDKKADKRRKERQQEQKRYADKGWGSPSDMGGLLTLGRKHTKNAANKHRKAK